MPSTKQDEVVRLLSKAHKAGFRGPEIETAIRAYVHEKPVSTRIASVQTYLARGGVIESATHQPPSSRLDGSASDLMREVEVQKPKMVYNGSQFSSWAAAAEYIDSYINKRGTTQDHLAEKYKCNYETISEKYRLIMDLDVVAEVYGATLPIPSRLSALLAERRLSLSIIRHALRDTTESVYDRVRALEKHGGHTVYSEYFGGVEFYWISPAQ